MAPAQAFEGPFAPGPGLSVRLRAVAFVEARSEAVADELARAGGEIIQRLNGMVIAAFGSAEAALRTCASLHADARVGVSCGDVLYENGALHGLPVIEASRLRDIAAPGQILCAARVVHASDLPADCFHSLGSIEIRGLAAPLPVCELLRTG